MKMPAILLLLIVTGLFSCVSRSKITKAKTSLNQQDSILVGYKTGLDRVDSLRQVKQDNNELADTVNSNLKKYITGTKNQIDTIIDKNTVLIKGNSVKKSDFERLNDAIVSTMQSSTKINRKLNFLEDLINRNMVVKLDQNVLFGPGSYKVDPSVVQNIGKLFAPAALEIDSFSSKYSDFDLSLVISLKGYSDATVIGEGSPLYQNLRDRLTALSIKEPDPKDLNKELSRARAEEVKKLFETYAGSRNDKGIYKKRVIYIYEGKGEQFPDPKITDYTIDDPRRRIVLLYWTIFPD
jgi:outer membrane protein OmpA-like peptidoglycan-associated protein